MLAEKMPPCLCGASAWSGGGGSIGPEFSSTWFKCGICNRSSGAITSGFHIVVIAKNEDVGAMEDWLNDVLLPFWRAEKAKFLDAGEAPPQDSPIPPRLPKVVTAYHQRDGEYALIDHDESYKVPVPPDPIAVKHAAFWNGVIAELELDGVTEVSNRYFPDNGNFDRFREMTPWYRVEVNGAAVVFGPRKRVYSIQVERPEPFDVSRIAARAKEDNTSYWVGDHWQPWDRPTAHVMVVHAWGREKLIEYMKLVLEALQ